MPEKIGVVLMAYGTPEKEEDVEPYLKDIFKGREVPKPVLQKTLEKYRKIGFSPLNKITLKQCMLVQEDLSRRGFNAVVTAGMKHWKPSIKTAIETLKKEDLEILIGILMHPFSSIMGSREYEEIFNESSKGMKSVFVDRWYYYEKIYKAWNQNMKEAIASFNGNEFYTIFTSHGLPSNVDDKEYRKELEEFSAKLAYESGIKNFCLSYQNGEHKDWYKPEVREKIISSLEGKGYIKKGMTGTGLTKKGKLAYYSVFNNIKEESRGVFYVLRKLYRVSEKELEPIYQLYMQETSKEAKN